MARQKRMRMILAMALALIMLVTGCSKSTTTKESSNPSNSPNQAAQADLELKPYELVWAVPYWGAEPKDMKLVMEEVNKIHERKNQCYR